MRKRDARCQVKRKTYYFICRRCGKRKNREHECLLSPGECLQCYNRRNDNYEKEEKWQSQRQARQPSRLMDC